MSGLNRFLCPFLCCFGIRSSEEHPISDLQTLPSALHLPASQIPHAANASCSGRADAEALQELFRTSSSVRGYRTASIPSGSYLPRETSLDTAFQSGSQEQVARQPSRLQQIGKHVKQKLSESGLRKSVSKSRLSPPEDKVHNGVETKNFHRATSIPEVSISHHSTGLLDLLQSRTGSEGGYDSDAKSIETAVLKSREGTITSNRQRAGTFQSLAVNLPHITTDGASLPPDAMSLTSGLSPARFDGSALAAPAQESLLTRDNIDEQQEPSISDPQEQQLVPKKPDGLSGLQDASECQPTFAFPILKTDEQDPFTAALPIASSASEPGRSFAELLKKSEGDGAAAKRESLVSNLTGARASLVSNLDPNLIDFISRNGEHLSEDLTTSTLRPDAVRGGFLPEPEQQGLPVASPTMIREDTSKRDLSSITASERNSVHLYNMRISQRLGSPSFLATSSRPNTSHTSADAPGQHPSGKQRNRGQWSTSGNPSGKITSEHNRRPSDPETRRLFEGERVARKSAALSTTGTSPVNSITNRNRRPSRCNDDASSFYWSDFAESNELSRHSTAKRNPNSIAVGGRSESISLPLSSSGAGADGRSVSGEREWFGRVSLQLQRGREDNIEPGLCIKRQRSVSLPSGNADTNHMRTNLPARLVQQPIEAKESMSVMSAEEARDARKETMTEISVQAIRDLRDEKMSEIEHGDRYCLRARDTPGNHIPARPDVGRASFAPSFTSGRRLESGDSDLVEFALGKKPNYLESATNLWQRSFRRALQEPQTESMGGFLTAPKFDRDGRRRSSTSSISAGRGPRSRSGSDLVDSGRLSQHEDDRTAEIGTEKLSRSSPANPGLSVAILEASKRSFNTLGPSKASRKRSLLNIGRRFSVTGASKEAAADSGASTPLKDFLGLWGRFPSHTREDRCDSAGAADGVAVRDFAFERLNENRPPCSPIHTRSATALEVRTSGSWNILSLAKQYRFAQRKPKGASPLSFARGSQSLGMRPGKGKIGLAGRLKRFYRTGSMDFQSYIHHHGHRSSVSMGASAEYPELEVVPGILPWRSDLDGTTDNDQHHLREVAKHSPSNTSPPIGRVPWHQTYSDCVGSLSALKSDPELDQASQDGEPGPAKDQTPVRNRLFSTDLRESTINFQSQLGKEKEAAKEGLIRKVESMQLVQA